MLKARLARKPTVAATVLNSAAPCTVSAQPAMRATTHSQRKRTRWKTQLRTINYDHEHDNDRDEQDEDEDDQLAD